MERKPFRPSSGTVIFVLQNSTPSLSGKIPYATGFPERMLSDHKKIGSSSREWTI
jgi:hypothetical protein